jgi:hypothetical protein
VLVVLVVRMMLMVKRRRRRKKSFVNGMLSRRWMRMDMSFAVSDGVVTRSLQKVEVLVVKQQHHLVVKRGMTQYLFV